MAVIGKYVKSFDVQDNRGMDRRLSIILPDTTNIGLCFGYNNARPSSKPDYFLDIDEAKDLRDTLTELIGDKE